MKNAIKNIVRQKWSQMLLDYLNQQGEDCGRIGSNVINFPIVQDGEEGWIEITVKVPNDDEGYEKRDDFVFHEKEKAEKAKIAAEKTAKKIATDKKMRALKEQERERKRKEREERGE